MTTALIFTVALLLGEAVPTAPSSAGEARLVTGSAPVVRGRLVRARAAATERALADAVWQRATALVPRGRQDEALRRKLGQRVRDLIARYRTRKVHREGATLSVILAVTVDEEALKKRLAALGVPLLAPGILLLAHCDEGELYRPLAAALGTAGIRAVRGPWLPVALAAQVAAVRARPQVGVGRARAAGARVALVASCHPEPPRQAAPGVTGVRVRVLVTLHAVGSAIPTVWQADSAAVALGGDRGAAARAGLAKAVSRLVPRLGAELPRRLPAGPARTLRVQVLGALALPGVLALGARASREVTGVQAVVPRKLARGETWFDVRTVLDPAGLREALARLTAPAGYSLTAQIVQPGGHLALTARLLEEQP